MAHCVNRSSEEFKELADQSNMNPIILAAKVSLWQEENGLDNFPTVDTLFQLKDERNVESAIKELDNYLLDFMKPFGVRSKEFDELKTKSADPSLTTYIDSNNKDYILKKDLIKTKYNLLVDDNIIVNNSLNQYNTKDNEFNQQKGFVNQQHLSYRFWTIFTIIIIIIVLKYILGINSPSGNIMIWTTVIVLASFSLN